MMKTLFYLAATNTELSPIDCVNIYINICRGSFRNIDSEIKKSLKASELTIVECNEDATLAIINAWDVDMANKDEYISCDANHAIIKVCIGIYWNFITKRLTSANIDGWLKKRRSAYSKACILSEDDEALVTLSPDLGFADKVNQMMASIFPFKTIIFRAVQSLATGQASQLSAIAKITMVYFSMAELTGYAMIYEWIMLKNPILLTWNGLAKHSANLVAANTVFRQMGNDGPYCKFLFPHEKLQMFTHAKLGVFIAVAYEISMMEGQSSFKNYNGVSRSDISDELAQKCRLLVNLYGGAHTKTTSIIRKELLDSSGKMDELYAALDVGLGTKVNHNQEGPSSAN